MKKSQVIAILLVLVLVVPMACKKKLPRPEIKPRPNLVEPQDHRYSFENPPVFKKEGELSFIDGQTKEIISKIDIEIADTDFDRALGLMFRPEMADTLGMLFLFPEEEIQAFWMRNTLISLDIIYVNAMGEIVSIYENTPTLSDRSMPSEKPAINVVEVNAGYCKAHDIEIGDMIDYQ